MEAGAKRAVVIGINEYDDAPTLLGCVRDARGVAATLSDEHYNFSTEVLLDQQATRANILDALWSAVDEEGASLVIYFAGHGQVHAGIAHLVSSDGTLRDPGIGLTELAQIISAAAERYQHVVAILDACHSGAGATWVDRRPFSADDVASAIPTVNNSRILMAACRPDQVSFETSDIDVQGAFTRVLIRALQADAVDFNGNVTVHSLFDRVSAEMDDGQQTPVFKGDSAGSVILGSGFPPRQGAPVPEGDLAQLLGKAEQLLDQYYTLQATELSQPARRSASGLAACARRLAEVLRWFSDTEVTKSELANNTNWKQHRLTAINYNSSLARLSKGDILPDGQVVEEIGSGGFGRVWRVENSERAYAFKCFHGSDLGDIEKVKRFRNGFHSMSMLSHPRIVRVHHLTEAPLGIAMDHINGTDLRGFHIDRSEWQNILRVATDIADTVSFAHGSGVVHRDIKPENVIMGWDDSAAEFLPYLTDFDLSYVETSKTVTINMVGGVVNYAAPEQFYRSDHTVSRAPTVDVYAFVQLLYYLYLDSNPAADRMESNVQLFKRAVSSLHTREAAELLIDLYERGSRREPAERIQEMEEVVSILARATLLSESGGSISSQMALAQQVGFTYAGPDRYATDVAKESVAFHSKSGVLEVRLKSVGVPSGERAVFDLYLSASQHFGISGASSGDRAREIFNQRIDRRLKRFKNATRHAGAGGYFSTRIRFTQVPIGLDGVAAVSELLLTCVSAIEGVD